MPFVPAYWRTVRSYPSRLMAWLKEGSLGLTTIVLNFSAMWFAWFWEESRPHEDLVRACGAMLQCVGVLGVIWGVLKTREQFGLPSASAAILGWMSRFPALFLKPIAGNMSATLSGISGSATGSLEPKLNPNASLEEKVQFLLSAVEVLKQGSVAMRSEIRSNHAEFKGALNEETRQRSNQTDDVRRLLTSHATGGLNLTLCGALFLLVGVLLGTLPYSWF